MPPEEQRACARRIVFCVRSVERERLPHGHTLSEILALCQSEPGFSRFVEEGVSKNATSYREDLEVACMVIATEFHATYPGVDVRVNIAPGEELARPKTNASRRIDEHESRRRRYEKFREIEVSGKDRAEAKREAASACDVSIRTVERDIEVMEGRVVLVKNRHSPGYSEIIQDSDSDVPHGAA